MPADVYGQLPGPWWKKFEALNKQPRPSKREEAGVRHIQDSAQSLGFQTERDSACNLAVHVPASPGFERSEPVCLQAHVDMVIAKRPGTPPDVDPEHGRIPVERASLDASGKPVSDPSGPYLWAPHSTLGADDGIGCVMGMVLCEDQSAVRPPIKLLITIDEEEGMSGADGVDVEQLKLTNVRRLINLDSEDDREVTIGGAGGLDSTLTLNRKTSPLDRQKYALWTIAIDHLMGGHSGLEIHKSRANAIRLCAGLSPVLKSPVCGCSASKAATRGMPSRAGATRRWPCRPNTRRRLKRPHGPRWKPCGSNSPGGIMTSKSA